MLGTLAGGLVAALGRPTITGAKTGKVGVCHRADDPANPYTYLQVSEKAVREHRAHGDAIDPDFQTDPNHCGACGTSCGGGETCSAGACEATSMCAPGSGGGCVAYGEPCIQNTDCDSSQAPRVCRPPDANTACNVSSSEACCLVTGLEGWSCDEPADCRDFGLNPGCVEVTCENNVCASRGVPCCNGRTNGQACLNLTQFRVCCGGICCEVGQGCTGGTCQ